MTGDTPDRSPSDQQPASLAAPTRRWGDLGVRLASAVVMVAVAISTALVGGDLFVLVWLAAALAAFWEWQRMIGGPALRGRVWVGALALTLVAVVLRDDALLLGCAILLVAAIMLAALAGSERRLWAAAGAFYAGALLLAAVGLRLSALDGARSILWLFATVWATDTFAYFGGRLIGGPKLAPRISPSKTWSGTLTGVLTGTFIGVLAALYNARPVAIPPVVAITVVASLLSQVGDAFESAMKRRFGIKDSSRLIPGHGGVMDRVDGFVAAAVFAFCIGLARDPHSIASGLFHPA